MVMGGLILGMYVGLWWALIGGIVQIVQAVKAPDIEAMSIALGVVKILFAGSLGTVSAILLVAPGMAMLKK